MSGEVLRIATRGSALARWQASFIAEMLGGAYELVVVETTGDQRLDVSIAAMGGQGVFVKEVQTAVLEGRADIAVHSAKDLPSTTLDGLCLAAVPERADPRDALSGTALDDLREGARVGTGSVRRRAQLAHLRPDLTFGPLRGNIATRLARRAEFDAVVVALAALDRLGLVDGSTHPMDTSVFVPQVGQGALAVECRADDAATVRRLAAIEHEPSRRAVDAERSFLATLGGGCDLPVGAHAVVGAGGFEITLTGLLARLDGGVVLRHAASGPDPAALGRAVAEHLLDRVGGRSLLAEPGGAPAP